MSTSKTNLVIRWKWLHTSAHPAPFFSPQGLSLFLLPSHSAEGFSLVSLWLLYLFILQQNRHHTIFRSKWNICPWNIPLVPLRLWCCWMATPRETRRFMTRSRAFFVVTLSLWNALCVEMNQAPSFLIFRKHIETLTVRYLRLSSLHNCLWFRLIYGYYILQFASCLLLWSWVLRSVVLAFVFYIILFCGLSEG